MAQTAKKCLLTCFLFERRQDPSWLYPLCNCEFILRSHHQVLEPALNKNPAREKSVANVAKYHLLLMDPFSFKIHCLENTFLSGKAKKKGENCDFEVYSLTYFYINHV